MDCELGGRAGQLRCDGFRERSVEFRHHQQPLSDQRLA